MDEEQPERNDYEKVSLTGAGDSDDEDQHALLREPAEESSSTMTTGRLALASGATTSGEGHQLDLIFGKTLLSDNGISIRDHPLVQGKFTVKLLKFITLTFIAIAVVHLIVEKFFTDRDQNLKLWYIWVFDTNLIVMDCVIFFLVGRLWKQRGVDHLGWILTVVVCNCYFESQNYFKFLQHSVTLYQMHCVWPWKLWVFVLILVPTICCLVILHVLRAYRKRVLLMKLVELSICAFFFLAPVVPSRYFHLHHWFAGWLLGMHCNFDVWWSRLCMAWCWGMYINGIAVYGRDPVLTCEYAYYLSLDQSCPFVECYLEGLRHPKNETIVKEMIPVDWRNCSADGYHP